MFIKLKVIFFKYVQLDIIHVLIVSYFFSLPLSFSICFKVLKFKCKFFTFSYSVRCMEVISVPLINFFLFEVIVEHIIVSCCSAPV